MLNYFTTLTSRTPTHAARTTAEEFAIQKSKIVTAINGLDADVVALQEIENSVKLGEAPDEALADLVAGLNAAAGSTVVGLRARRPPRCTTPRSPTSSRTRSSTSRLSVKPSGEAQTVIDETVWDNAREPIAQTFKYGKQFVTVVANHFKSKTPPDPNQQPARTRSTRTGSTQAKSLLDLREQPLRWPQERRLPRRRLQLVRQGGPDQGLHGRGLERPALHEGARPVHLHVRRRARLARPRDRVAGRDRQGHEGRRLVDQLARVGGREYWGTAAEAGTPFRSSDHDPIVVGVGSEGVPGTVDIDLVTVNDFHGRIEQSAPSGGIAALSSAVKQIRAENPNTVFAAAGDMIGASTFTSFIQQDVPTIEALNAAGLDVSSVGNHEFDQGFADLTDRVMPLALWEYLGANVYEKGTTDARPARVLHPDVRRA